MPKKPLLPMDSCRPSTIAIRQAIRERAAPVIQDPRRDAEARYLAHAAYRLSVELDHVLANVQARKRKSR